MEALDKVIKNIPEKLIKYCEINGDYIVILLSSDVYEKAYKKLTSKKKGNQKYYKGYLVEMNEQADTGSIYITTRK